MTETLLYLPCSSCQVWLIAGKGAAADAEDEVSLENAAMDAGWTVGPKSNLCPGCAKEKEAAYAE